MSYPIDAGTRATVTRDITVGGLKAFRKGEDVVVERIEINPDRPEFRNVVFSVGLQKRFQLSDNDLEVIAPFETPPQEYVSPAEVVPRPQGYVSPAEVVPRPPGYVSPAEVVPRPQGYGMPPGSPYAAAAYNPPNEGMAVASLVLGIVSFFFCIIVTGVLAIVFGSIANNRIAASGGLLGGAGMARAGIICGWISIALDIIIIIFYLA